MKALWILFTLLLTLGASWPAYAVLGSPLTIVTEEWPPFTFEGDGLPKGMGVELVQEIQKITGNADPIQLIPWARAYNMALTQPNVLIFTIGYAEERAKKMTFLGPIGVVEIALFAKDKEPLSSLEEVPKNAPIGVMLDTLFHSEIEKAGFKNTIPTNSHIQAIMQLNAGRVDYIVEDPHYIKDLARKHSVDVSKIKKVYVLDRRNLYFGFSKGTSIRVVNQWKEALTELQRNGTLKKIIDKWMPGTPPPKKIEVLGLLEGSDYK